MTCSAGAQRVRDAARYGVEPLDSSRSLFVYYDTESTWTRIFMASITAIMALGELIGLVCFLAALFMLHRNRSTLSTVRFRMHRQLLALLGFQVGRNVNLNSLEKPKVHEKAVLFPPATCLAE